MSELSTTLLQHVCVGYGLEIRDVASLTGGYDDRADSWRLASDRGPLVLRVDRGTSLETACWLADVQQRAAATNVPTCSPLIARDGTVAFQVADATVTVRPLAEGAQLDRDDPAQVRAAGRTLALLHSAALGPPVQRPRPSPWDGDLWSGDGDPAALRDPELDAWHEALIASAGGRLARGVLHGDFWAGNIVWAAGRVVGVIDFAEARLDVLARELAWSTWEFGHDDSYQLDVERARPFLAGYHEVRGPWEAALADVLIGLMRVELRRNARYCLGAPGDAEYCTALQREFRRLRRQPPAPLLRP